MRNCLYIPSRIAMLLVLGVLVMMTTPLAAQEPLQRAEEFLRIGDVEQALELLRELQVDRPDDDMVLYGIAMAYHRRAERLLEVDDLPQALEALSEAQEAYTRLGAQSEDAGVAADAFYNSATLQAEASKLRFTPEDFEAGVARIRAAIEALETVVAQYPEYDAAQHNLEHMRLTLKEILSNPPESEESEEDQEDQQDTPQPFSIFEFAETDLDDANAEVLEQGDTVLLRPSQPQGGEQE